MGAAGCGTAAPLADASSDASSAGTDVPGRRVASEPRLTVATLNLGRFFDTVCASGSCEDGDYEVVPNDDQFRVKADRIAQGLAALEADVVLLQEVETQACLDALTERLGDRYPVAVLGEIGSTATLDVAILSAGTLVEVRTHRQIPLRRENGSTTKFSRELLEVHVDLPAVGPAVFFATHFKSKHGDDEARRLAEANAARDIVAATATERPEALIVFGGDINDFPGSEPMDALLADGSLEPVFTDLEPAQRITWGRGGWAAMIDHLFRAAAAAGALVPGSVEVIRDGDDGGYALSDHAALRATFSVGE